MQLRMVLLKFEPLTRIKHICPGKYKTPKHQHHKLLHEQIGGEKLQILPFQRNRLQGC